jgi:aspartate kinase
MKIFKFGGASIKDAQNIHNVSSIIQNHAKDSRLLIVISALGKTTNRLEELLHAFFHRLEDKETIFSAIRKEHFDIINSLKTFSKEAVSDIENTFLELEKYINDNSSENYDFEYDQIVSFGELLSSRMVYYQLLSAGLPVKWIDVRTVIRTDNTYREGQIDWDITVQKTKEIIEPYYNTQENTIIITQGFLGGTSEGLTTTLGREGSDFSAAIMAYSLGGESVTIWKDVDGLLNADPQLFSDTVKLDKIPYGEAIELAYYGASVIHPKTLQPLQNKNIPLYVRSFIHPDREGSIIHNFNNKQLVPCFIAKRNQVLISISSKDFSFIAEENLSTIFGLFAFFGVKINLMQNSAISFSLCVDYKSNIKELIEELKTEFFVKYNFDMELFTIRYYNQQSIDRITNNRKVILEQKSRLTVQYVMDKIEA